MKRIALIRAAAAVVLIHSLIFSPSPVQAADCTWNGGSGNWNEPANWSNCAGGYPGAGDTAAIGSGTATVNVPVSIQGLTFSGGTINGSQPLTVTDSVLLDGGAKTIAGITFNNEGTAVWNAGSLTLGPWPSPATFNNQSGATFEIAGALNSNPSQASVFNNFGTLRKTGAGLSNLADSPPAVQNYGLIKVEEGQLRIHGANFTHPGAFEILAGATLQFDGSQHFGATASLSGAGNVTFIRSGGFFVVNAGTTYNLSGRTSIHCFNCSVQFHNAAVTGELALIPWYEGIVAGIPQLEGEGSVTVTGLTLWQQGVIGHTGNYINNGPITVNMQGGLELSSLVSRIMRDAVIRNHGEAVFSSGDFYISDTSARFENLPGATFTIAGARDINYYWSAQDLPLGRFINQGSLVKSGSGTATITSVIVENSGLIDVQEGGLVFQRRPGSTHAEGGARLILDGGQVQSTSTLQFTEFARLQGHGELHADVQAAEEIAPGFNTTPWTPGLINIHGDLSMGADSRLRARLVSSSSPGSGHDQLAVSGQAQLAGRLVVQLADGYLPPFDAEFDILTCALDCSGSFEAVEFHPSEDDFELILAQDKVTVRWIGESGNGFSIFLPLVVR